MAPSALRAIHGFVALVAVGTGAVTAAEHDPLPGMTYASLQNLPKWNGWWTLGDNVGAGFARQPPPLRPELLAKIAVARKNDSDPDPNRWCRPPQFTGYSGGFVDSVEFLFTPGRVTLTSELGVLRRIYTDGRALPRNVENTNMGTSVGHWEGDTLVVETVGINPHAHFPGNAPGAPEIGQNARVTERIRLKDENTLELEVTLIAPDILTAPDKRTRLYARAPKKTAREVSFCVDYDRSIDPTSGKQRFDMTPPKDLPPPPPHY
jgi:hypothetical protein